MNCLLEIAQESGRDYLTPEDVSEALRRHDVMRVRVDLLDAIGNNLAGCEDTSLCCYIAHRGTPSPR